MLRSNVNHIETLIEENNSLKMSVEPASYDAWAEALKMVSRNMSDENDIPKTSAERSPVSYDAQVWAMKLVLRERAEEKII